MGRVAPGECAFFELPAANEPLTIQFKIRHPGGFLQRYELNVIRGSNTAVPVTDTTAPDQDLFEFEKKQAIGLENFKIVDVLGERLTALEITGKTEATMREDSLTPSLKNGGILEMVKKAILKPI